ncbi:hypothetical protein QN277_001095 [Acacia crassicarpa]|uniref:F-box domain-containing protein n=1 Tax=Acacia crassicarpa TaxID=499986 RepID=A0AAE1N942_9FABA|nr:hypothetical protein QN277_001095 [Acacia crassicarpa]
MEGGTLFLPQEITTNILKRLSVRCLLRFQCVCKLWKNLIKSASFIKAHLHHSRNRSPFLVCPGNPHANGLSLYLLDCEKLISKLESATVLGGDTIIGSSYGLLCYQRLFGLRPPPFLFLRNLATRETIPVPKPIDKFKGDCICDYGFGFSPIVNDYKIVKIHFSRQFLKVNGLEVYSLGSRSWKKVELENIPDLSHFYTSKAVTANRVVFLHVSRAVTANGVMFWRIRAATANGDMYWLMGAPEMIISFDLATFALALLPMPPLWSMSSSELALIPMPPVCSMPSYKLAVFENKLAVLSLSSTFVIELWVMEQYTGPLSKENCNWTKKYTICTFARLLDPAAISRNEVVCSLGTVAIWRNEVVCSLNTVAICRNEVVCQGAVKTGLEADNLYLLNPASDEYRTITISKEVYDIFNFSESLVPLSSNHIEALDLNS